MKNLSICGALIIGSFLLGLINLSGFDPGEDRGWAAVGLLFFVGPSLFTVSFLTMIIAFLTKSRIFLGCTITSILMIFAWMIGIFVNG